MTMNIRKTALGLGSALMLLATTLNAQEQPWSFGVKAGMSMCWLAGLDELASPSPSGAPKMTSKTSSDLFFTGGLTAGYAFHKNIGVGLEVIYTRLGGKLERSKELPGNATDKEKEDNKPQKVQILSHNLAVPVMLKIFPMGCDPDDGILAVDLGAQFSFPFAAGVKHTPLNKETGMFSGSLEEFKDEDGKAFDKSAQLKSMTMGLIAGVSYEFPEIGLTVDGRFHLAISDILKDDSEAKKYRKEKMALQENNNLRGNFATFSVGYNFARLLMD
jgi:opacity protein-like surface antigen